MKFLLKMKAWQICVMSFGFIYVIPIVMMNFGGINHHYTFQIGWILFIGLYVGYLWTLGVNLKEKIPSNLKLKSGLFNIAMAYGLIYNIFFIVFSIFGFQYIRFSDSAANPLMVIMPFHIIAMICMFYGLTFVARALVTAEKQTKVKADDYIGVFFMLWFFPIGIWFIQPRINKLFKSD